jgi:hypothetical protein
MTPEAFYVLSGEYLIFADDEEWVCPAGSFVYIPAGVPHGFRVGSMASSKLNLYAPAAMVGYFDEPSDALTAGVEDPDVVADIAARYCMEVRVLFRTATCRAPFRGTDPTVRYSGRPLSGRSGRSAARGYALGRRIIRGGVARPARSAADPDVAAHAQVRPGRWA